MKEKKTLSPIRRISCDKDVVHTSSAKFRPHATEKTSVRPTSQDRDASVSITARKRGYVGLSLGEAQTFLCDFVSFSTLFDVKFSTVFDVFVR